MKISETSKSAARKGLVVIRVVQWGVLVPPVIGMIVSSQNLHTTWGADLLISLLTFSILYAVGIVILERKMLPRLREEFPSFEEQLIQHAHQRLQERRETRLKIEDHALADYYAEMAHELDSRIAESGIQAFYDDMYCIVRQNALDLIADLTTSKSDATPQDLIDLVRKDSFYNRRYEREAVVFEYDKLLTRLASV